MESLIHDKYERVSSQVVSKGRFGSVHLVRDKTTGEQLALKTVVKRSLVDDDHTDEEAKRTKSAKQEAFLLSFLRHQNIIEYKNFFENEDNVYILMEYCDGGNLQGKMDARKKLGGTFTEDEIFNYFIQLTLAISYIHQRRILHRDIKPENIYLTKNNVLKLGDFGIATVLDTVRLNAQTQVGTILYACPEILDEKPYDYKSDIWSMGIVLYQLTCLDIPFAGSNLLVIMKNIQNGDMKPIPVTFSENLRNLLKELLHHKPEDRPTIEDILQKSFIMDHLEATGKKITSSLQKTLRMTTQNKGLTVCDNLELLKLSKHNDETLYLASLGYDLDTYMWTGEQRGWFCVGSNEDDMYINENATAAVVGNRLFIFSCWDEKVYCKNDLSDPLDTFVELRPSPNRRSWPSTVAVGGDVYLLGGKDVNVWSISPLFERYDVASDKWENLPSPPTPVSFPSLFSVDEKIYALGGESQYGACQLLQVFDLASKTWNVAQHAIDQPIHRSAVAVNGNQVFLTIDNFLYTYDWTSHKLSKVTEWPENLSSGSMSFWNDKIVVTKWSSAYVYDLSKKEVAKLQQVPCNEWSFCFTIHHSD